MNKRLIAIGGGVVILFIAVALVVQYISSLQKVIFIYDPNQGSVSLTGSTINGSMSIAPNKELILQKGQYRMHISGDNAQPDTRILNVQDTPIRQTIPISLPDKRLRDLLGGELPAINAAIAKSYPNLSSLYSIKDTLYDRGQWYGAVLTYKGTDGDNRDTLRLVAHKEQNEWKLTTTPPQPLLSTTEFPSVPREILDSLNKPSYLPGTNVSPAIYPN